MGDEEATGYIGGAVTPEMEEAFGKAVDWVGETANEAVDWVKQEASDIGQTVSQGIDTVESWVEENPGALLE
jgi:hypothetical protein